MLGSRVTRQAQRFGYPMTFDAAEQKARCPRAIDGVAKRECFCSRSAMDNVSAISSGAAVERIEHGRTIRDGGKWSNNRRISPLLPPLLSRFTASHRSVVMWA